MELSDIKGFGKKRLQKLAEKEIRTPEDLLGFLPVDYYDASQPLRSAEMTDGVRGCFSGFVLSNPSFHRGTGGRQWVAATIGDSEKKLRCMWFNQPWVREKLSQGDEVILFGQAETKSNGTYIINPVQIERGKITPVYRKIPEIGQKTLRDAVRILLDNMPNEDWMPPVIREKYALMARHEALESVHFPEKTTELNEAKRRLAFEELLLFQGAVAGGEEKRQKITPLAVNPDDLALFLSAQSFEPTGAQRRAMDEIVRDLAGDHAMARMVQGDVGCGKTLIALAAMFLCVRAGGQAAMMAPTEILAAQHFESAAAVLGRFGITCGLLTGRMTAAEHRRACEQIESGKWQVVIGTHALISKGVRYANLRLVITDEQHRFGVRQRTDLGEKGNYPHVLVMSATPIPRTLSLILYGDMDLTIIDELPPGRTPVTTRIVPDEKREGLCGFLRKEAQAGHQCYVVCPLIGEDEPDEEESQSAHAMAKTLRDALPELNIALLHGQMRQDEKEAVLSGFYSGQVHILVSTTVIEVGVNVPNATVMVIEGADRFGLAQLHQLRGRVGRGAAVSWCFLLGKPNERLRFLCSTNDGFEIARKDLEIRGAGEYFGTRQSGAPEMPALALTADSRLLEQAREAFMMLSRDPAQRTAYEAVLRRAAEQYSGRHAALN